MAKANPLKKITAEAKRIRKARPGKSWKSAVKEAGKKYRTGSIKPKKKKRVSGTVGKVRRKSTKRKKTRRAKRKPVTTVAVRTTTVRARRVGRSAPVKRHRMAGRGSGGGGGLKKVLPWVLLAGAAFLVWKAMKPKSPALPSGTPPLYQSSNPIRNDKSNQIVQYAIAAGLTIDAISKLIQSLNQRDDNEVENIYDELDRGGELPATLYA